MDIQAGNVQSFNQAYAVTSSVKPEASAVEQREDGVDPA